MQNFIGILLLNALLLIDGKPESHSETITDKTPSATESYTATIELYDGKLTLLFDEDGLDLVCRNGDTKKNEIFTPSHYDSAREEAVRCNIDITFMNSRITFSADDLKECFTEAFKESTTSTTPKEEPRDIGSTKISVAASTEPNETVSASSLNVSATPHKPSGLGIAMHTISALMLVAALVFFGFYYCWRQRGKTYYVDEPFGKWDIPRAKQNPN